MGKYNESKNWNYIMKIQKIILELYSILDISSMQKYKNSVWHRYEIIRYWPPPSPISLFHIPLPTPSPPVYPTFLSYRSAGRDKSGEG